MEGNTTDTSSNLEEEENENWVIPTNQTPIASEVKEEIMEETDELTESPTTSQPQTGASVSFTYQKFTNNEDKGKTYMKMYESVQF